MLRYSAYMESRSRADIVIKEEEGGWCLGEWCTPEKVALSPAFVNTCLYIQQLGVMQRIAGLLQDGDCAAKLEQMLHAKREAVQRNFWHDGIWDCGTQGADCFAYAAGIIDLEALRPFLEGYKGRNLDVGLFGLPILIEALFAADMEETALDLLCNNSMPSFGYMLASGATTLWEYFQGGSNNHPMFGAFVAPLIRHMLGICLNEDTAGFTGDFKTGALPGCSGSVFTPNGYITI